jgi:lipopolysaccharide transport system permease protein
MRRDAGEVRQKGDAGHAIDAGGLRAGPGSAIGAPSMTRAAIEHPNPAMPAVVLEFTAGMSFAERHRLALRDGADAVHLWRLAWMRGWFDIRLRYRGSMLGPFWLTLSTGVMIGMLGVLYSALFHLSVREYLPYLAMSQILWLFLSTIVSEACTCFTLVEAVIRSIRMPFMLHALRNVVRNLLVLAHNVVVIVIVYAVFGLWPGMSLLLTIPALLLWFIDAVAVTLLLGMFCARFRDIPPIVGSLMQIFFFVTPILWKPEQLGHFAAYLPLNPFYVLLEILRGPLIGAPPPLGVWLAASIYSLLLCMGAWLLFVRARGRLAFWI